MPEFQLRTGFEGRLPSAVRKAILDVRRLTSALTDRVTDLETLTAPSAWTAVSFQNSWVNYGSGTQEVEYRKIGDVVHLRGKMKDGTVTAAAFTMPAGYRPPAGLTVPVTNWDGSVPVPGQFFIDSGSGEVYTYVTTNVDVGFSVQWSVT